MKFILVIIYAAVVAVSAIPTEKLAEQCALCNNYVALLTSRQIDYVPSEFELFEEAGNFEKLCAACNLEEESSEEADILLNKQQEDLNLDAVQDDEEQQDEEQEELTDATNFISITNCKTCKEIIDFTAKNSLNFSYPAIKSALSQACSSRKIKLFNDTRCRLFIATRKEKIIKAILRHHLDSTGTCLDLEQC